MMSSSAPGSRRRTTMRRGSRLSGRRVSSRNQLPGMAFCASRPDNPGCGHTRSTARRSQRAWSRSLSAIDPTGIAIVEANTNTAPGIRMAKRRMAVYRSQSGGGWRVWLGVRTVSLPGESSPGLAPVRSCSNRSGRPCSDPETSAIPAPPAWSILPVMASPRDKPGGVPAIHACARRREGLVERDARNESGHDDVGGNGRNAST